jgi:hypothetical protein
MLTQSSLRRRVRQYAVAGALAASALAASLGSPLATANVSADTLAAPASDVSTAGPAYVAYNDAHPVLAYYYGWWEPERLQAGASHAVLSPRPGAGQVINDADLVREHIRLAQDAGIDGFVANSVGDMARLMSLGRDFDFRASVQIDAGAGPAAAAAQLADWYSYIDDPAMIRYEGRPVIFFWRATADPVWSAIRAQIDPNHVAVWLADGDNFNILRGDAWDGISPYQIAWSQTPQTQLPGWGAKAAAVDAGKLYVPPVAPGCNDAPARPATCVQARRDGSYYQQTLQGALNTNPQWAVIVSTWNEWLEDTQIEPGAEYGDLYLRMTRDFANQFKGDNGAPVCC